MATMETRLLPEAAVELILEFEEDGKRLSKKSEEAIRDKLFHDYLPYLEEIPSWHELTDNQRAAIISFAWSTDPQFYLMDSKDYNAIKGDLMYRVWKDIPQTLRFYNKKDGKVDATLAKRRRAESQLWRTPSPNSQQIRLMVDTGVNVVYKSIPFTLRGMCTPAWEGLTVKLKVNDKYYLKGKPVIDPTGYWELPGVTMHELGKKTVQCSITNRRHNIELNVVEPPSNYPH